MFFTHQTGFLYRSDLIDQAIERAVSLMQSVVEAGRYIRDVKVVPIKVWVYGGSWLTATQLKGISVYRNIIKIPSPLYAVHCWHG